MICPDACFLITTSSVVSSQICSLLGSSSQHRQPDRVVNYLELVHIVSPALMPSVVIKNPVPSSRRATALSHGGDPPR